MYQANLDFDHSFGLASFVSKFLTTNSFPAEPLKTTCIFYKTFLVPKRSSIPNLSRMRTIELYILSVRALVFFLIVHGTDSYQVPNPDPQTNAAIKNAIQKTTGTHIVEPGFSISDDCAYQKAKFQKFSRFCNDKNDANGDHPIWDMIPPLSQVLKEGTGTETAFPSLKFVRPRAFRPRVKLGRDDMPTEYWFDNRIHTFGNSGFFGGLHASVAPFATWLIDTKAYDGIDARKQVAHDLRRRFVKTNARIADLCCGVGMSTRALASAFQDAEIVCGIDTSSEMIEMAKFISKYQAITAPIQMKMDMKMTLLERVVKTVLDIKNSIFSSYNSNEKIIYTIGNSERIKVPKGTFDLVTIM
jgi:SAM-dependent methyltransferase